MALQKGFLCFSGLMDLPHLMENLTVDHKALGQATLAYNSTAPTATRNLLLTGMKENNRVAYRPGDTI
jgi:hypothetical protein